MGDSGAPRPGVPHLLLVQQAFLVADDWELDFDLPVAFKWRLRAMRAYFGAGLAGATHVTVQTDFMRRRLVSRWGVDPALVDVTPSAPAPEMLLQRCVPVRQPESYVVYLSSAGYHKNHRVLPRMLRRLADGGLRVRCVLTASRDELPGVATEADTLRVADLLEFRGGVDRLVAAGLLAGATAHVVPSKLESFGLGYLEAMAMGCPVVAADRVFARELCGKAALLADADAPGEFAEHVARLISSEATWLEWSTAARKRYEEVAQGWDRIAARYRSLLGELAE